MNGHACLPSSPHKAKYALYSQCLFGFEPLSRVFLSTTKTKSQQILLCSNFAEPLCSHCSLCFHRLTMLVKKINGNSICVIINVNHAFALPFSCSRNCSNRRCYCYLWPFYFYTCLFKQFCLAFHWLADQPFSLSVLFSTQQWKIVRLLLDLLASTFDCVYTWELIFDLLENKN